MNKKPIFTLLACIMLAAGLAAQPGGEPVAGPPSTTKITPGEKKGWPSEERYTFIASCITEASAGMSEDSARFYCYCMQERIEKRYPTVDAASKITEKDMESAAFKKDINDCLGGTWDSKTREDFLSSCIREAKPNLSEEKAKSYCECMMFKVEKAYPDATKLDQLTSEKLSTPGWKKIIQGCLEF